MEQNNKIEIINDLINLTEQINLTNINIEQIKLNINKLSEIYLQLKTIYSNININEIKYKVYPNEDSKCDYIKSLLFESFLAQNHNINTIVTDSNYLHCLKYSNIEFYWLDDFESNVKNYDISLEMIKMSICLNQYRFTNNPDKIKRIIIWIPIDKQRNFSFNQINKSNLKKTEDNFEAFVASGVTFGSNPKFTIVTRYEEVEKLLIHELIHNYGIDGSNYHNKLTNTINKYKILKNNMVNNISSNTKINYDYEYSIYESYTELLSTYFYLLFKNLSDNIQPDKIKKKLLGQIIVELIYSYNLISNLAYLNGFDTWDEFKNNLTFEGDICVYEYYFIKGLMYNNYQIEIGTKLEDYKDIYQKIIDLAEKIKLSDDQLLKQIYKTHKKQQNFKYQIH